MSPDPGTAKRRSTPAERENALAPAPARRRAKLILPLAAIAALTAIQLWGLTRYFPIDTWTNRHPFYTSSYALHFARSLISCSALARHFRLWSYSPSLMAGYPAGTRTEPMGDAVALWFWICSGFSNVRSFGRAAVLYKMFVVGALACAPLAMASAALWLGFDWTIAAIAAALGVFGTFNYPGLLMIRAGMFAFFACAFRCVAWSALLYDSLEKGWRRLILLAVSGALLTYLHPLAAVLLVPASLGALAEGRTRRRFLAIAAILAGAFLLSLGWLAPILLTRDIGVHFAHWWKTARSVTGGLNALFRLRLPFPPILVAALAAYGASRAQIRRRFMTAWLAAVAAFGVLAYFGSALNLLGNLEPGRFEIAFYSFGAPFAALGARDFWMWLKGLRTPLSQMARAAAAILVAYFALVSGASLWVETAVHGPIETTLPEQAQEIWGWMKVSGRDSRVLMESGWTVDENGGSAAPYFKSDIGLLWALQSEREVIGGSPSEGFSSFSFADLGNAVAFGKPLDDWTPEEFRKQLDIYNIGAMIVWSTDVKDFLGRVDGLVPLQQSDPYALFGVAGDHTFLISGKAASVEASQDCIQIKAAEPGRLVLKYHYFKTLRADPSMPITPVSAGNGDPNPFIQIDNQAKRDIRIYNAGFTGWGRASAACE